MKQHLERLVRASLDKLMRDGTLDPACDAPILIEHTRDDRHGDFASNVAMNLAKSAGRRPRELAQAILENLASDEAVERVEIAGPGFINFFLSRSAWLRLLPEILTAADEFGTSTAGASTSILLEFVSANPTGPLHIGHGRGAAYGAALANVLSAAGHQVTCEYYVNDAGRQMEILALSVWLRYLQALGQEFEFPPQAYRGEYLRQTAARLHEAHGRTFEAPAEQIFIEAAGGEDPDDQLDRLVAAARSTLGPDRFKVVFDFGLQDILGDIRDDLAGFGVDFDIWFSENSLIEEGKMQACIDRLRASGDIYEKDGAMWFASSRYGDEKDRVVVRENGQTTYFASDIAYHLNKFERGYDRIIDIWGADHHGYIARVKAAIEALGRDPDNFHVLWVQFAVLYRGGEKVQMSTRSGEFVTLRELRDEIGKDAARFFYVTRKSEQHLDFDLDLAKSQSNDNPVYYIQYAHARICSVMRQLHEKGYTYRMEDAFERLNGLVEQHESALLARLSRYPEVVLDAARLYEPHMIGFYLRDLANDFHTYYNSHQFLVDDEALRNARVTLILAVRQVIRNGLRILGVSAPEEM